MKCCSSGYLFCIENIFPLYPPELLRLSEAPLFEQFACNHHSLYLGRTFVYLGNLGVSHHSLYGILAVYPYPPCS